ncbi:hypothetical protein [Lihuaxuella thermophila]|uniref:Uncharacterized protein n=1 Tax=Lihuaxuella thermophila TaxID=1173111 RepID=A0A1H8CDZ2_9BACL|nr:hypothetical protein [Lihuaxuella thermophila]SEM93182.1 hypothetical protein SAMN05444955_103232 [Lihuaxuella thermophila]
MGNADQLAYSFKGRRLGYKYRVLRQRIRPLTERISSDQNFQLPYRKLNRSLRAKVFFSANSLESSFGCEQNRCI